ncbi:MAG: fatty acid desaturase [Bryobacterales bacterium]|nr:fatty acid desaturase [Bryobacterales bacterium]
MSLFALTVVLVTLLTLQISVFLTTVYLHRTLTHRGLELHPAVAFMMHLWLMVFTGISPKEWVAVHRKHHQFSDKEGDPHSPYIYGLYHVLFGNVIYYRRTANDAAVVAKYAKDYRPTPIDKIRFQGWGVLIGLGLYLWAFGPLVGGIAFVLYAVAYLLLNASINSVCHMIGYRNFDNLATNVRWIAFLTGGEGLHNNHHEYPTAAHFAMKGGEFDPAWGFIRMLESFGLARVKRLPVAKAAA